MSSLSDKKFNAINNFLNKYIDKDASKYFREARKNGTDLEWLKEHWDLLEEEELWNRSFKSLDDLTLPPFKQMDNVYNSYPDYDKIPKAKLRVILDEGDFTEEQLKHHYDARKKSKEQIDKINEERWKAIDKQRNEGELAKDKSYFTGPFANEYARKAYIQGNNDLAGKQEFLGKTAAVSDFMPFPVSLMGPAIRVSQKYNSGEDIMTPGTALDFAGAVIPDAVEKPTKLVWQYLKRGRLGKLLETKTGKQLENRINAADDKAAKQAAKDIESTTNVDLSTMSNSQLIDLYNNVKTPEIKKAIEEYWQARGAKEEARNLDELAYEIADKSETMPKELRDRALKEADLAEAMAKHEAEQRPLTTPERKFEYAKEFKKPELQVKSGHLPKDQPLMTNGDLNTYYKDVPLDVISEYMDKQVVPSMKNDALYNILMLGGRKFARSTIGQHKWDEINYDPKYDEDKAIKDIISMYSDEWLNNRYPHMDDPLVKTAYDKWINDLRTSGNNLDKLYRIGEY